ncbi:hypothetical protein QQ045_019663 [Rhodiola kirilowii]
MQKVPAEFRQKEWSSCKMGRGQSEGGLGIKNLQVFNEALVLNQLWDMMQDSVTFFGIKAYWTKGHEWWEVDDTTNNSWILRRLAHCKRLSDKGIRTRYLIETDLTQNFLTNSDK